MGYVNISSFNLYINTQYEYIWIYMNIYDYWYYYLNKECSRNLREPPSYEKNKKKCEGSLSEKGGG